jgi:DivIVA domain-containing protein
VALGRETIEKTDFPLGRRGYDPAAVDAHLAKIADEVEALKQAGQGSPQPVASAISEQVRGIVDAAEKGATEIQARAEEEARAMKAEATRSARKERQQAARDAKREREEAAGQAREYVGQVSQSTSKMLERLQTIDADLDTLTVSLRAGAERLKEELEQLEDELEELSAATAVRAEPDEEPGAVEEAEPPVPAEAAEPQLEEAASYAISARTTSVTGGAASAASIDESVSPAESTKLAERPPAEPAGPEPETAPEPVAPSEAEAAGEEASGDDSEGARLIALNMALNGTPREETERYLAENFSLRNRKTLLDEVYASVEG